MAKVSLGTIAGVWGGHSSRVCVAQCSLVVLDQKDWAFLQLFKDKTEINTHAQREREREREHTESNTQILCKHTRGYTTQGA